LKKLLSARKNRRNSASGVGARGNDTASAVARRCLPKAVRDSTAPEAHGRAGRSQFLRSSQFLFFDEVGFCFECQKPKPCCCGSSEADRTVERAYILQYKLRALARSFVALSKLAIGVSNFTRRNR
jgi:hypothetical protein